MTRFHATNTSSAVIDAELEAVWASLTDPDLVARLTPNLKRIDAEGDRWVWHLTRIPVLSTAFEASFTEVMTFEHPERIGFTHDESCAEEMAGVEGEYVLQGRGARTWVCIDLAIWVELPLPRVARPAVERVMNAVIGGMGMRFGHNLRRHLKRGRAT